MFGLGNMGNNCNKMEKPKLKLTYFNGRGRGELARLILAHGGREFEDCRIEQSDWPAMKASKFCKQRAENERQCGNFIIILSLRFFVNSLLGILELKNLTF